MPEQPKQLGAAPKEPVIYTIPEQFYGLAAKAQLPSAVAAPAAAPSPNAPAVQAAPAAAGQKGSKAWILIPIVAVLLLAGIGVGIWLLPKPKPAATPAQPSVTLPTTPTPQPEPTPTPEPEPEPIPVPEPATTTEEVLPPALPSDDEDGDGLTTAEETLYGTDAAKSDTDTDGFSDSVEVVNLYNPAGFRPTRLIEAGPVDAYASERLGFDALVPTSWTASDAGDGPIAISSGDPEESARERIALADGGELGTQTVLDAFLTRNPGISPAQVQSFSTKSGLEAVRSPDGTTAFVAVGGRFLVVLYEPVGVPRYASTFAMFLNSLSARP